MRTIVWSITYLPRLRRRYRAWCCQGLSRRLAIRRAREDCRRRTGRRHAPPARRPLRDQAY